MKYSRGDLVLISDDKRVYTCILLTDLYTTGAGSTFYYSHCVETGTNGIIYENEIISMVSEGFSPEFEYESNIFDQHYWFEMLMDSFTYWPSFWAHDDDEDD